MNKRLNVDDIVSILEKIEELTKEIELEDIIDNTMDLLSSIKFGYASGKICGKYLAKIMLKFENRATKKSIRNIYEKLWIYRKNLYDKLASASDEKLDDQRYDNFIMCLVIIIAIEDIVKIIESYIDALESLDERKIEEVSVNAKKSIEHFGRILDRMERRLLS